ncbi:hypothetical protein APHAL10511_001003 [Amanita phalloides]|nr:hypothetical protein APHAL10511_001003 [Amanita phalloides]
MQLDEAGDRRIPTLVSLCQRVAGAHVDSITTLGSEICFHLAKPILERCSAEQLLLIEKASPQLEDEIDDLWMDLCIRKYPRMAQRYLTYEEVDPKSWRDRHFAMQEAEAKRLEELGCRLRSQRQEAEELKKERAIKLTDRVPPGKRLKIGWGMSQPKSLFQKTRSEASKMQKAVYRARALPPMPASKGYAPTAKLLLPPPPQQPSRVTVNTVKRRLYSPDTTPDKPPVPLPMNAVQPEKPLPCNTTNMTTGGPPPQLSQTSADTIPNRPHVKTPKKDPMACLFLPKHRASSQRPTKV